ncbi:proton-coupled zinc antiporter SLC30A2-like [Oppia nitens]|uniref:proton-coupled zinc antiporter SLC30A2-like n=1 Tax=Oppia nitens TaxID=1686743 RepID=UPI0023DB1460|nr:proton-coupled zinc antiporter SLC30A2-like [Oppia nitens]XP_054155607.1 proton-coupled zinc antiporter SLC30A2-like [Oppia nitens]XP_054155614.1 proton-coupled zinc antiporter SLC30A2-like [Oppia nitens]
MSARYTQEHTVIVNDNINDSHNRMVSSSCTTHNAGAISDGDAAAAEHSYINKTVANYLPELPKQLLAFDDRLETKDNQEVKYCRCDNCAINNSQPCLLKNNNHITTTTTTNNNNTVAVIDDDHSRTSTLTSTSLSVNRTLFAMTDQTSRVPYKSLSGGGGDGSGQSNGRTNYGFNVGHNNNYSINNNNSAVVGYLPAGHDSQLQLTDTTGAIGDNHHQHSWSSTNSSSSFARHCHPTQNDDTDTREAVSSANRKLVIGCILCGLFMIGQFVGGYFANSLAIMTDAAHVLSDLVSFVLSLFAIWLSQKRPTKRMSFGFYRAEVLGAVTSILMIWIITIVLVYLAAQRIRHNDYEIEDTAMLIVAGVSVGINILIGLVLSDVLTCGKRPKHRHLDSEHQSQQQQTVQHSSHTHSHSHGMGSHGHSHANMNLRAAIIHVIGDLIQSIGVLIAALIIHFKPEYKIADPICTFIFSALVMLTTYGIMRDALLVLMEGLPQHLDYTAIKQDLLAIDDVQSAHSLHIWSLAVSRVALAVHLAVDERSDPEVVLRRAESLIRDKYGIQQTTVQVERFDARLMNSCVTCKGP